MVFADRITIGDTTNEDVVPTIDVGMSLTLGDNDLVIPYRITLTDSAPWANEILKAREGLIKYVNFHLRDVLQATAADM